jgi:hypothetical protein
MQPQIRPHPEHADRTDRQGKGHIDAAGFKLRQQTAL